MMPDQTDLNAEDQLPFLWVDQKGRPVEHTPDVQTVPFKALLPSSWGVRRADAQCTPCDPAQEQANNVNLIASMLYMAQSPIGRMALKIISDVNIGIGYQQDLKQAILGADATGLHILLNWATDPEVQHVNLILLAMKYDTIKYLANKGVELNDRVAGIAHEIGDVSAALHGLQCLEIQAQDPQRFIPPLVAEVMDRSYSRPASPLHAIYKNADLLEAHRRQLLALATGDPTAAFKAAGIGRPSPAAAPSAKPDDTL